MSTNLRDLVKKSGGTRAVAKSIGVSAATVSQWLSGVRPLPERRAIAFSRATEWRVTPHELYPRFYPHPDDGLPEHLRGRNKEEAA